MLGNEISDDRPIVYFVYFVGGYYCLLGLSCAMVVPMRLVVFSPGGDLRSPQLALATYLPPRYLKPPPRITS